jgi:geranylgeranyl pyrophosphate synthase
VGAILGGASDEEQKALADYGMNLGMAFQLTDDLLDFTSTDSTLGKNAGVDLLGGKVTLPLINMMSKDRTSAALVQTILADRSYDTVGRSQLIEAVERTDSIRAARDRANEFAMVARASLDILPDGNYLRSLRAIPTYVLDRDH